jgi:hypothetical protein
VIEFLLRIFALFVVQCSKSMVAIDIVDWRWVPTKLVTLTTMLSPSQRAVRVKMRRAASATPTTTHIHLYTSIHVQHKVISSRNVRGGSDMAT